MSSTVPPDVPSTFEATRVLELELEDAIPAISAVDDGRTYRRASVLVRLHDQPLGLVELELPDEGLDAGDVAARIWPAVKDAAADHLRRDALSAPGMLEAAGLGSAPESICRRDRLRHLETAPSASVIVATHERPDQLKRCLNSLLEQDLAPVEIIVVDSGPTSNATHDLVRAYGDTMVYVRVDRPGLALAHNVALRSATGSVVAFIDDDVVADRHWLAFLVAGFAADTSVGCTTGLILPLQLETRAQSWTVSHSRLDKGFARRVFDLDENRPPEPLYPYTAGVFGSGTNMAFSAAFLHENGGFDTSLGVGTVTRGGDDLAAFFDVIERGYRLVYEPGAIVWHDYRRDDSALARHFFSYGMGLSAYLTRAVAQRPRRLLELGRLLPRGVAHMMRIRSPDTLGGLPRHFVRREWAGMAVGPFAYAVSRRRVSRDRRES